VQTLHTPRLKFARAENGGGQRRRFLVWLGALAPASALARGWPRAARRRVEATLAAYVDTLLPADALTPAASALGVHRELTGIAAADAGLRQLFETGCDWLDRAAAEAFHNTSPRVRETVVAWMADSDPEQGPRRFYEIVRQRALEAYYSHPAAWGGLPLTAPPQPLGHPEPWR
jgi:hypothetical protein